MKKLRDKKTGEIKCFGNLQVYAETENTDESQLLGNFDSFEQILEYYEDYIPKGPLIKDENDPERAEKTRRIVREWAEFLHINQDNIVVSFGAHRTAITGWQDGLVGGYSIDIPSGFMELHDEMRTTITELCGEEYEPQEEE